MSLKIRLKKWYIVTIYLIASELLSGPAFFVITLGLWFLLRIHIEKKSIKTAFPLIAILFLGALSGLFDIALGNLQMSRAFVRDAYYVACPIVYFLFAQGIVKKKLISFDEAINSVFWSGIYLSLLHFFVIGVIYKFSISAARGHITGYESIVTIIALMIVLSQRKRLKLSVKAYALSVFVMSLSLVLFLSRTVIVMLLICFLVEYARVNRKSLKTMLIFVFTVLVLGVIIYKIIPENISSRLMYKVLNVFNETSSNQVWTIESINSNWRGYEKMLIREEMLNGSIIHQLRGYGFGKLLDLQMSINLAGSVYDSIGSFHNGYYFVWYKTGLIGLLCLPIFILLLLLKTRDVADSMLKRLIIGVILSMSFQMYASMGIFSGRAYAFIILFIGFFLCETIQNKRTEC